MPAHIRCGNQKLGYKYLSYKHINEHAKVHLNAVINIGGSVAVEPVVQPQINKSKDGETFKKEVM